MLKQTVNQLSNETKRVLQQVENDSALTITKWGKDEYVIMKINDYHNYKKAFKLVEQLQRGWEYDNVMTELDVGVNSFGEHGGYTTTQIRESLGFENEL